jgi:hypothetical protein
MVNTVSAEAVGFETIDALETAAGGVVPIDIQSSGITNRAKTFPLRPVPRSPDGDISDFLSAAAGRLSVATLPLATGGLIRESAWVETAFELARFARAKIWA